MSDSSRFLSQEDRAKCFDLLCDWFYSHGMDIEFGITSHGAPARLFIRSVSFADGWAAPVPDAAPEGQERSQS